MQIQRTEIVFAFIGFIVIGLSGGAGGILLPTQLNDYNVSKSTIGLLFVVFSAGYTIAGVVNGWLLRRLGLRYDLVLGTAVFTASMFFAGLRPAFGILLALTALIGVGTGVIDACLNSYLATMANRIVLLNVLHACHGAGALIGPIVASGMLANGQSWGHVYWAFAAATAPLVVVYAMRYPRALPDQVPDDSPPVVIGAEGIGADPSLVRSAIRHPAVLLSALFLTVAVGVEVTLATWSFSFLVEERGQSPMAAGWVVSGFWLGFTLGRFMLGMLAKQVGVGAIELTFGCLVMLGAGTLLSWSAPFTVTAVVGFILVGAALGPIFPLTIATLPRLAPDRMVPTAIGVLVGVTGIGSAFVPWLAGIIAEGIGLESLLPFAALLAAMLLGIWWWIVYRIPKTSNAVKRVTTTTVDDHAASSDQLSRSTQRNEAEILNGLITTLQEVLNTARANRYPTDAGVELLIELTEAALVAVKATAANPAVALEVRNIRCPTCTFRSILDHIRAASTTARFALVATIDQQRASGLPMCRGDGKCNEILRVDRRM